MDEKMAENQETLKAPEEAVTAETGGSKAPERKKTPREEAYDWLIDHHVTTRVMDIVLAVLIAALILVVLIGMF